MDMSTQAQAKHEGKRASIPKHGKKPENRLYTKFRRGPNAKETEGDGTINPDGSIMVAAVCGNELRIYEKAKFGRRLDRSMRFDNHGQAMNYAAEFDEWQRLSRASGSRGDPERVYPPFYQVKVAGHVIDHTNSRERAHGDLRMAAAKPAELWQITDGSTVELLERVA